MSRHLQIHLQLPSTAAAARQRLPQQGRRMTACAPQEARAAAIAPAQAVALQAVALQGVPSGGGAAAARSSWHRPHRPAGSFPLDRKSNCRCLGAGRGCPARTRWEYLSRWGIDDGAGKAGTDSCLPARRSQSRCPSGTGTVMQRRGGMRIPACTIDSSSAQGAAGASQAHSACTPQDQALLPRSPPGRAMAPWHPADTSGHWGKGCNHQRLRPPSGCSTFPPHTGRAQCSLVGKSCQPCMRVVCASLRRSRSQRHTGRRKTAQTALTQLCSGPRAPASTGKGSEFRPSRCPAARSRLCAPATPATSGNRTAGSAVLAAPLARTCPWEPWSCTRSPARYEGDKAPALPGRGVGRSPTSRAARGARRSAGRRAGRRSLRKQERGDI